MGDLTASFLVQRLQLLLSLLIILVCVIVTGASSLSLNQSNSPPSQFILDL